MPLITLKSMSIQDDSGVFPGSTVESRKRAPFGHLLPARARTVLLVVRVAPELMGDHTVLAQYVTLTSFTVVVQCPV